ncbi:hypothetical protein [Paractinoplanes toevensis]|uniref:DUF2716 domain-containing protein n=1 Tax=Paractinoplanes toevensis TaxID=571911 RepID=A0A919TDW3_9ACTN|nr:hypothetical protein [Actinoplanes toevensis]GIM93750.1 hypothetical protein Ato02nite_055430 [Actinoplanes toevensis]
MTLTPCEDPLPADWISLSELPWHRLVTFGPEGYESYARLRLLPDPAHPGESENDVYAEDWRDGQLARLFGLLAAHTATPDDCYFCAWEGLAQGNPPAPAPQVIVPHRRYWLFRGPLADAGNWPESYRLGGAEPAFAWPSDRAWWVTLDVDPHWAGIAGPASLIGYLTADPHLDVVAADPAAPQPAYR